MYFSTSCIRLFMPKGSLGLGLRLSSYQYLGCRAKMQVLSAVGIDSESHEINMTCQRYNSSATKTENLGKEVYDGPLASRIRRVKLFCLMTSSGGVMFQPIIIQKILEEGTSLGVMIFSGVVIQFFTFVTPFLLHYVTKRYVRTIYYNSKTDDYTALTYNFWTATKMLTFKTDDVVVPDIPGMFTSVVIKGSPLFIEVNYFNDVYHYKRIMGYDKPIDFKLEEKPTKQ